MWILQGWIKLDKRELVDGEERHRRHGTGVDVWPPPHICIQPTLGFYGALWGSTVALINSGDDLVTNSTHLFPTSRPTDMLRAFY